MNRYTLYLKDGRVFVINTGGFKVDYKAKRIEFYQKPYYPKSESPEQLDNELDLDNFLKLTDVAALIPTDSTIENRFEFEVVMQYSINFVVNAFSVKAPEFSDYSFEFYDTEEKRIRNIYVSSRDVIGVFKLKDE